MKPMTSWACIAMLSLLFYTGAYAGDVKSNIKAAYEALNKRDFAGFTKLCDPSFTEYAAGAEPITSPKAAIEAYQIYFTAFPDLHFSINEISKGDDGKYYLDVTIKGTNTGPFWMLPATNKAVQVNDIDIIEVNAKGLAVSHRSGNPNAMLDAIGYGSLANPSTFAVMSAYEMFGRKDLNAILAMSTDDVVFDVHDLNLYDNAKTFKGKAAVKQFFQDLDSKLEYTKFQPWRFVSDGDDVFVLVSTEFRHKATGRMVTTDLTHHFRITDGKVSYFKGMAEIQKPYDSQRAEANVRALFNDMDAGRSDLFEKYCSADFRISNPFLPTPSPIQAFQGILNTQKAAFPDMKHEVLELTTDGHYVTARGIFRGTNTGPMMGNPPTGNKVELPFLVLDELDETGKIKNRYVLFDMKSFESQLMANTSGNSKK